MTTSDYLEQLTQDRDDLVDNLTTKGITGLTGDETFTELVPEVLNIPSGTDPSDIFNNDSKFVGSSSSNSFQRRGNWSLIVKKLYITNNQSISNADYLFYNFQGEEITGLEKLDFANVTSFQYMFSACKKLKSLSGYKNWNMSSATNLYYMFNDMGNEVASQDFGTLELDVSNWDLSNATNLEAAFRSIKPLKKIKFSGMDLRKATSLKNLVAENPSLTEVDFSNVQTRDVTSLDYMFLNCNNITTIDLSSLETPNLTSMYGTFQSCYKLTYLDIRKLDMSNVSTSTFSFTFQDVPVNCLIIVADATQKSIITTNFPSLTNVKTVAEYEAS